MDAAWDFTVREGEAGLRRFAGTDTGESYRRILAFEADQNAADPEAHQRTVGDLVSPQRSGSATQVVNAVSRDINRDVGPWNWQRIRSAYALVVAEARERQRRG